MAVRANNGRHGSLLEQALAQLILNQAQFVAQQAQFALQHAQFAAQHAQFAAEHAQFAAEHVLLEKERIRLQKASDERFERIEALLLHHDQVLRELPDAIRKKIGYQQK
jgi:hypothetical protein